MLIVNIDEYNSTNGRPVLSSEREPQVDITANV
jgi:hypothetical protein